MSHSMKQPVDEFLAPEHLAVAPTTDPQFTLLWGGFRFPPRGRPPVRPRPTRPADGKTQSL